MSKKSILTEYWEFLKYRKKFWLLPILVIMMGLGLVLYFGVDLGMLNGSGHFSSVSFPG